MSLSSSTLSAIQKAGAAVFAADEKLKKAAKGYAERVNAAVAANPYDLGNDSLMEDWKKAARLSQTFAGIEAEIRKAFQIAAQLSGEYQPDTAAPIELTPTEVVIKPKKRTSKSKTSASKSTSGPTVAAAAKTVKVAKPARAAGGATDSQALSGNAAKLFAHLANLLNTNEFTTFSQTAVAKEIGIPLGSMTAAAKKLLDMGRIKAGPAGSFKLAEVQQPVSQ